MKRGKGSPRYGTLRTTRKDGYVRVWRPGHPVANTDGYALEHRYVLHEAGVDLPSGMHVHHKNGCKNDNRIENLEVISESDHHRHHVQAAGFVVNQFGTYKLRPHRDCDVCGTSFKIWNERSRFCSRACFNASRRVAA